MKNEENYLFRMTPKKRYLTNINTSEFSWLIGLNSTFTSVSAISWCVEETGLPGETHPHVASHRQTLSHNVVSSTPCHEQGSNSQL
jgi:hypothetical protein